MAIYDVSTTEKKASPSLVAGGTLYADNPLGTILPFGSATIPSGWLLCDGTAISRTTYSELFAVIGTAFGSGDGSTTFNLPDMRESVPKGAGLTGKTVGAHLDADGLAVGEFLDDRYETHAHYVVDSSIGSLTGYGMGSGNNAGIGDKLSIASGTRLWIAKNNYKSGAGSVDSRDGDTTEVKSVGVNYIIKAKMVAVPADFLAKVDEAMEEKLTWHYATVASNGDVAVPSSYNGFYEVSVFDANRHIFHSGLRLGSDIQLGSFATNFSGMNNDGVRLLADTIRCSRESSTGNYVVAYRPIQAVAIT